MKYYAGLDVSLKEISVCLVDETGQVLAHRSIDCTPEAVAACFAKLGVAPNRIVHESGPMAIWLQRGLVQLGLPVQCIDARHAHKALSARRNKSDRGDAEGLAHLARTGWVTPVHIRSHAAEQVRTIIGARARLVRLRKDLEAHIRGVLKTFGIRMTAVSRGKHRQAFRDQLAAAAEQDPALALIATPFIAVHETLCRAAGDLEDALTAQAKDSPLARDLMTAPGVGPLVALNFMALVDDPERFRRAADVGAYLGLTPRRHQSGERDTMGRISCCGDAAMRGLLFEAAQSVIHRVKRASRLKSWAMRLVARRGVKKATIAVARKLAVLMLTLWKTRAPFNPAAAV